MHGKSSRRKPDSSLARTPKRATPARGAKPRTFGILTGGGDAPGLNAVIRAFVKTVKLESPKDRVLGIRDGFSGLLRRDVVELDISNVRGLLPRGGTVLGTSNRDNPFEYPVKSRGVWKKVDRSAEARRAFRELGLDGFVAIGGDGTIRIARDLGFPLVAVPKTIDNDLGGTEVTFGFRTAVETAAMALDRLHSTAESHHRVLLLEVMGRYAGFIALSAGLAGGADFILIPEIPYRIESLVDVIKKREKRGSLFSVGVVAEGAHPVGGQYTFLEGGGPGAPRLGGAADRLARELEGKVENEVRCVVLGHLQRGGSPCAEDRVLATRFGVAAAKACLQSDWGVMVGLASDGIVRVDIDKALSVPKRVDPEGPVCRTTRALGICLGE